MSDALNPLATALFSTASLALIAASGSTCSFVSVRARSDNVLEFTDDATQALLTSTSMGVFCQGHFYNLGDDPMWKLSFSFLVISLVLTSVATIIAWAISTCWPPSLRAWRMISAISALSALVQVPVFLMYETEPCSDYLLVQTCEMSKGSYLLVASMVCSVAVTLITQCLDPPLWVNSLDEWRVQKERHQPSEESSNTPEEVTTLSDTSFFNQLRRWNDRFRPPPSTSTGSPRDKEEGGEKTSTGNGSIVNDLEQNWAVFPAGQDPAMHVADASTTTHTTSKYRSLADVDSYFEEKREGERAGPKPVTMASNHFVVLEETKVAAASPTFSPAPSTPSEHTTKVISEEPIIVMAKSKGRRAESFHLAPLHVTKIQPLFRSRPKASTGYALMDDDDIQASFPVSPPFEVVTFGKPFPDDPFLIDDDEDDILDDRDPLHVTSSPHEQELLATWNALHNLQDAMNCGPMTEIKTPLEETTRKPRRRVEQQQPLLTRSASEDDANYMTSANLFDDFGYVREAEMEMLAQNVVVAEVVRQRRNGRRRKKKIKARSVNSVASSPSLLDTTIAEETAADLEESENAEEEKTMDEFDPYGTPSIMRTRSAPTLARFDYVPVDKAKMSGSVRMDGLNNFHMVETWWDHVGPERKAPGNPPIVVTPNSSAKLRETVSLHSGRRMPIFREERILRGGIHATISVTSSISDDSYSDPSPGYHYPTARQARMARVYRLQQMAHSQDNSLGRSLGSSGSDGDILETLDLQLIEVQRPHGAEYGPEEASL